MNKYNKNTAKFVRVWCEIMTAKYDLIDQWRLELEVSKAVNKFLEDFEEERLQAMIATYEEQRKADENYE